MKKVARKKGTLGILYLDRAPKLYDEKPTANPKNRAKIKHIRTNESLEMYL
jgi:hypothetical protein